MRDDRTSLPESEQNAPEDKSVGFKPWTDTKERYWMGNQWGETYKEIKDAKQLAEEGGEVMLNEEDQIAYEAKHGKPNVEHFEDTSEYDKNPDRFLQYAKQFVVGANAVETAESGEYELTVDDLYIVWFAKVLGNWKALISTSISGDGLYFEVTHNGEKQETYVDIYKKSANHVFSHHDH